MERPASGVPTEFFAQTASQIVSTPQGNKGVLLRSRWQAEKVMKKRRSQLGNVSENQNKLLRTRNLLRCPLCFVLLPTWTFSTAISAQHRAMDVPDRAAPDASRRYPADPEGRNVSAGVQLQGSGATVVRYRSAERDGETEEVPLALVDLAGDGALAKAEHDPVLKAQAAAEAAQHPPVLSPELRARGG